MAARRQPGGGSKQEQLDVVDLADGVTVVDIADVVVAGAADLAVAGVIDVVADGGVAVVVAVEIADDC